jgi:hypothetical protein
MNGSQLTSTGSQRCGDLPVFMFGQNGQKAKCKTGIQPSTNLPLLEKTFFFKYYYLEPATTFETAGYLPGSLAVLSGRLNRPAKTAWIASWVSPLTILVSSPIYPFKHL